jgi:uncharacterized membrane protein YsdA (DUF1294 family)/cold shock CspA family protein
MRGVVVRFDADRGFGFIRVKGLPRDVFVHVRDVPGRRELRVGQLVTFDAVENERGPRAQNIVPGRNQMAPELAGSLIGLAGASSIAAVLALWLGWHWLLSWLAAINLVVFALYGWDKQRARAGKFRIPELTLHVMAVVGGSAGAFVARQLFHHKTRKASFRLFFWAIVVLQASAVTLYLFLLS